MEQASNLMLLFPTKSLLTQVTQYLAQHSELGLTIIRSSQPPSEQADPAQDNITIVDATEEPDAAVKAFESALAVFGCDRVLTYTEIMHPGLELFIRTRGGLMLLGPMTAAEWDGCFQSVFRRRRTNETRGSLTQEAAIGDRYRP